MKVQFLFDRNESTLPSHKGSTARKSMTRLMIAAVAAFGLIVSGSVATVAAFTDSATSEIVLSAGTLAIGLNSAGSKSHTVDFGDNFHPGVVSQREMIIYNTGTLPFNFGMYGGGNYPNYSFTLDLEVKVNGVRMSKGNWERAWGSLGNLKSGESARVTLILTWKNQSHELDHTYSNQVFSPALTIYAMQ